jgi:hypothetical protein
MPTYLDLVHDGNYVGTTGRIEYFTFKGEVYATSYTWGIVNRAAKSLVENLFS